MALSRVSGTEDIFISGIFAFRRASLLEEHHITHVLSVIKYSLDPTRGFDNARYTHLSVDIDDVEEADILVHLPKMVRFIHQGLYGSAAAPAPDSLIEAEKAMSGLSLNGTTPRPVISNSQDAITPAPPLITSMSPHPAGSCSLDPSSSRLSSRSADDIAARPTGSVLVHCAMGKSRSVTAVVAYLLWKHPHRFGGAERRDPAARQPEAARAAVMGALKWVRQTRSLAEPNDGFMRQLELWWEMGCPADSDDSVLNHRVYRRWVYRREVEEAAKLGMAPDRLMFEDEENIIRGDAARSTDSGRRSEDPSVTPGPGLELRCKKCRRVLATKPFVVPHATGNARASSCSHFVEPLSWMRPTLEEGLLEGRLVCPGPRCGASIGRYSWQGFKCSCGEWVCPAFSLQRSKVDEVVTSPPCRPVGTRDADAAPGAVQAERMAALGIRMPPGRVPLGAGAASVSTAVHSTAEAKGGSPGLMPVKHTL